MITPEKKYFKANLHCHTTCSDGCKTPEEIKQMYIEHGYSVVAYTDHDILLDRNELCDDEFIALNGFELGVHGEPDNFGRIKTCHLCFIAVDQNNLSQICRQRTADYLFANAPKYRHLIKFDESKPDFIREYTPECINTMIAEGRKNGFFVTYNHPTWSHETLFEYGKYRNMNAMEICNYGCLESGFLDCNEKEYDEILYGGQKAFCISADDNHNYRNDSFGGFTVINADKLDYKSITQAMEHGDFYASQGPKISELWFEDSKMGITCSDAEQIYMTKGAGRPVIVYAESGKPLNSAVFDVKETDKYVRITVCDSTGKKANTNAYFTEDLL